MLLNPFKLGCPLTDQKIKGLLLCLTVTGHVIPSIARALLKGVAHAAEAFLWRIKLELNRRSSHLGSFVFKKWLITHKYSTIYKAPDQTFLLNTHEYEY